MARLAILGVGALLVGLLAGLGAAWATRPPVAQHVAAAATAADSVFAPAADPSPETLAVAATAAGDSSAFIAVSYDETPAAAPMGEPITRETPTRSAPGVAAGVAEAVPAPTPYAESTTSSDPARRLAKVFAAMRPADAAAVLQQLSDTEARDVLLAMPERAAGAILTQFEPGRAATISSGVLRRGS